MVSLCFSVWPLVLAVIGAAFLLLTALFLRVCTG